jgi:hypothetical protein
MIYSLATPILASIGAVITFENALPGTAQMQANDFVVVKTTVLDRTTVRVTTTGYRVIDRRALVDRHIDPRSSWPVGADDLDQRTAIPLDLLVADAGNAA